MIAAMPVINAHGNGNGVWATLCTINGLELVQVEEGQIQVHGSKPCPLTHFSNFHHDTLATNTLFVGKDIQHDSHYFHLAWRHRFAMPVTRAPPSLIS